MTLFTIKQASDGIANLNIKLIPGKYIITSYWKDYKIGNTITING